MHHFVMRYNIMIRYYDADNTPFSANVRNIALSDEKYILKAAAAI